MEKITSVLNNAWTELNFTESSFYQKLITEKIPMIFEQEALPKVTEGNIPMSFEQEALPKVTKGEILPEQRPSFPERLETSLTTIYDSICPINNFLE
jgi:hypothetical protein